MLKAHIVIGANFGDEGKGRTTDWLAAKLMDPTVIRFNGGAQAGHTVVRNNQRHVFHHFGSGALAGKPTYLNEHFIVNPMLYVKELRELESTNANVKLAVSPLCKITTPWDMLFNQALENSRKYGTRHGSCGVGINATEERHEKIPFRFQQCHNGMFIRQMSERIIKHYEDRYKHHGLEIQEAFDSEEMLSDFVHNTLTLWNNVAARSEMFSFESTLIFEGAQGLLLDQTHEWFPHVTRSNTGSKNVVEFLNNQKMPYGCEIDVYYITRSYLTRHGNGPLPGEDSSLYYEDKTNVRHEFQGTLRYAPLSVDLLAESCLKDMQVLLKAGFKPRTHLVVTCLDQMESEFDIIRHSQYKIVNEDGLLDTLKSVGIWDDILTSHSEHGELNIRK